MMKTIITTKQPKTHLQHVAVRPPDIGDDCELLGKRHLVQQLEVPFDYPQQPDFGSQL